MRRERVEALGQSADGLTGRPVFFWPPPVAPGQSYSPVGHHQARLSGPHHITPRNLLSMAMGRSRAKSSDRAHRQAFSPDPILVRDILS